MKTTTSLAIKEMQIKHLIQCWQEQIQQLQSFQRTQLYYACTQPTHVIFQEILLLKIYRNKYIQSPDSVHCISPPKMEKLQLINDGSCSLTKTLSKVMSHNRTLSSHENFGVNCINWQAKILMAYRNSFRKIGTKILT